MPIRYVRDGLKVVRVSDPPRVDDPAAVARKADELGLALRGFAARLWRDVERRRRRETLGTGPPGRAPAGRPPEPRSEVPREDVRRARQLAGLSQRALAEHLHFGRQHISDIEQGRRSVPEALGAWAKRVLLEGRGWEPPR